MGWFTQIVEVQDFRKNNHHCKQIHRIYLELIKKNGMIATRKPVGLGNTGISTDYAPKSPTRTLLSSAILLEMATEYS